MTDEPTETVNNTLPLESIQGQAKRYLEAVYGKSVWFRAPETFSNLLERWVWAVANQAQEGSGPMAEDCMSQIEQLAGARRSQHG